MPHHCFPFGPRWAACLLALLASSSAVQAQMPRLPVAAFFENAPLSTPHLSPNGKMLAIIVGSPGQRDGLAVVDLTTNKIYPTARFADVDIGDVQWVNDQRLIFDTTNKDLAPGDDDYAPGLFAANYDGSLHRQLVRRDASMVQQSSAITSRLLPWHTFMMAQSGPRNTNAIYVRSVDSSRPDDKRSVDLILLDTLTGESKKTPAPGNTRFWLLDQQGLPRLTATLDGPTLTMLQKSGAEQGWKALASVNAYSGSGAGFHPLAYGADGTLYVTARAGKDKQAVYTVDTGSGKLSEAPLITLADYDFDGALIFSKGKLLGFRTTTDAETTIWIDPAMKKVQAEVDQLLPGLMNMISVPARPETPWVLVESYSDIQPTLLRLFNTETKAFNLIGSTRPAIDPARMARQDALSYKARDGMSIPALLTLPPGEQKAGLPMIVLVHGGPWVRGETWGWRDESQFLASRGYAVLEPAFRGTTGYGHAHFRASFKQWGLKMQDDLADGARWAVAQGIADPARICIAGASYGGYATLMGLVNDPDLFKCGVSWVGVTDIGLMYRDHWLHQSDMTDGWRKYGMPERIGDPLADALQLRATSPVAQAARIKQPVLLAYGGTDRRVPLSHGKLFHSAVKETNKHVEWVLYQGEGHGWSLAENRIDFWSRVEKFLDRHLGKQQAAPPAPASRAD